ncbi:MAG: trypsin-like peptidase domain-containing protein [Leptospiraceae bacterium]|nr:trypsin-like peptidase domain-containing protein [Leptospiraceae bacterium]
MKPNQSITQYSKQGIAVRSHKPRALSLLFIAGGIIFGLACGSCNSGSLINNSLQAKPASEIAGDPVLQLQNAFHSVYDQYKDSVVYISTEKTVTLKSHPFYNDPMFRRFFGPESNSQPRTQKQTGLGTGFILSADGYICTNYHVVAKMDSVKVNIGDKQFEAKVIGSDEISDIALLKVNGISGLKPVTLGDSDKVRVGDWAIAIGNPFGLDRTFTVGVISATAREAVDESGNTHIQTDASINPGNSGGPLINIKGEVVGVNRMIYSQTGGNLGIGFAIPINTAKTILESLRKYGKVERGYLGIQFAPMNPMLAEHLGLQNKGGVIVQAVIDQSPAAKAGIKPRDILLSIDGKPLEKAATLIQIVQRAPIGSNLKVQLLRAGKSMTIGITVDKKPD